MVSSHSSAARIDWDDPRRIQLYPIPLDNQSYTRLRNVRGPSHALILRAHTPGFVTPSVPDQDGIQRVTDITLVPDLLFLNPVDFFRTHRDVDSIWIEAIDPAEPVEEVSTASQADPIPQYLVIRRSELCYDICSYYRVVQHHFFTSHHLLLPRASEFLSTLPDE